MCMTLGVATTLLRADSSALVPVTQAQGQSPHLEGKGGSAGPRSPDAHVSAARLRETPTHTQSPS